MRRYAEHDLIRVDNCPDSFSKDDCAVFENYLKIVKGPEVAPPDLAVRKYKDQNRSEDFLLVFVGKNGMKSAISKILLQEGIK